jgi:hypothetical protein
MIFLKVIESETQDRNCSIAKENEIPKLNRTKLCIKKVKLNLYFYL